MGDRHPSRLGRDLVGGGLPWEESVEATMPTLLPEYTLRDSYRIGLYPQPNAEAAAFVRRDNKWTRAGSAIRRAPWPTGRCRW